MKMGGIGAAGLTIENCNTIPGREVAPSFPWLIDLLMFFLISVKVGGFGPAGLTNEICYHQEGRWRHLATVPHVESCNFGCAVLHNQLYIVGGCFNQGLQVQFRYLDKL
jgi:hypothetical protein